MEPLFLTIGEVLAIHSDQIELYGGESGIRDIGLLQSALAMPESTFDGNYLHADLFEMAAAYLFHIVGNHPFVDGNKRTGTVAALLFLHMNDIEVDIDNNRLADAVEAVASRNWDKQRITTFLRESVSSKT